MLALTKLGIDVFSPVTGGGSPRQIVPAEAQTWASEIEGWVDSIAAGKSTFNQLGKN